MGIIVNLRYTKRQIKKNVTTVKASFENNFLTGHVHKMIEISNHHIEEVIR